jgi:formylglycine-generating enzyme required for sulfatase activity
MSCPKVVMAILAGLSPSFAVAEPYLPRDLPKGVQVDMQNARITSAMADGRLREALDGIADYREIGTDIPPSILAMEARLAFQLKEYLRSKEAVSAYLKLPNVQADAGYEATLALYPQVEAALADQAKTRIEEAASTAIAEAADRSARASVILSEIETRCSAQMARAALSIATAKPGVSFRECTFAPEVVVIPSGSFEMGSATTDGYRNEQPRHNVRLKKFAIGKYEVTFQEWDACVAAGGCNSYSPKADWGRGRHPVIHVSWDDAQAYVAWLSRVTGKRYRLPSEAEWEYAARAGTRTAYVFGHTLSHAQANFGPMREDGTGKRPTDGNGTRPVGSYPENGFGLHDMHGNVFEWTQDCSNKSYLGAPADGTAWISGNCDHRVFRGGSWPYQASYHRSSLRAYGLMPSRRVDDIGFRVSRDLE